MDEAQDEPGHKQVDNENGNTQMPGLQTCTMIFSQSRTYKIAYQASHRAGYETPEDAKHKTRQLDGNNARHQARCSRASICQ